jgi:hypothetical protein
MEIMELTSKMDAFLRQPTSELCRVVVLESKPEQGGIMLDSRVGVVVELNSAINLEEE